VSMWVRLFPAVHGHIADSVRDHEPRQAGRRGRITRPRRRRTRFAGPLALRVTVAIRRGDGLGRGRCFLGAARGMVAGSAGRGGALADCRAPA